MFEELMPHPLSPQMNIGDIIVFLVFWAEMLFWFKRGTRNGR